MTTTAPQFLLRHSRAFIVVLAMMALAACGDSPTAPRQTIDRVAASRVVPAVTDARTRVTLGIDNSVVRDRLRHDLAELETALDAGDGDKARFHLRVIETVTADYRVQQGPTTTDGAHLSAIELVTIAVNKAIQGAP